MSNQLIVIGITGIARSGKDTIARILCSRFGFTRIALADGVRSAFRDLDGPTWELTKELETKNGSVRSALQILGTEAREDTADLMDDHGVNLGWVYLLGYKIMYLHRHHLRRRHRFVIPDIRFPYEQHGIGTMVFNADGEYQVWKVARANAGLTGELASHSSEREVAKIEPDITIHNNFTLAELETVVSTYARQLLEPSHAGA